MSFFSRVFACVKKEGRMKTTIFARILRLSIISLLIVAAVTMAVFGLAASSTFLDSRKAECNNYAEIYAGTVSSWTDLIRQQIENNAKEASFVNLSLDIDERKALLADAASETKFKDFSIAGADGLTYSDTDISDREYFINAMSGNTYISSPVVRKTDNSLTIMVASPMQVSGYNGVIYGGIDVDFFSNLINNVNIGDTGMGFIVDSEGTLIAYPDMKLVSDQINPIEMAKSDSSYEEFGELVSTMIKGENGTSMFHMPDGKNYIVGYSKVDGIEGWSVGIAMQVIEVNDSILSMCKTCLFVTAILLIIEIAFSLVISTNIAYPIRQAADVLNEISEGNLSVDTDVKVKADDTGLLISGVKTTANQLNSCIGEISDVLSEITKGNLACKITKEYNGDFVKIKESLELILDSLNSTFKKASDAADNLLEGAKQVEQASQALATASTEQASAVIQITQSIEEIAKSTAENTKDVIRVNDLTQTAKVEADCGNEQMTKMIEAMNDISLSSQSIAKIMKVIDDISFQTNILALNASVEAARAGVHGKGFAVVAEEVRSLAGKSSEAASEIAEMIDDTINKINSGTNIVSVTADELQKIVGAIDEIAQVMDHIASMSKDTAVSVDQVNTGIEQISSVVQTNSATSEECAASSVELSDQADELRGQIHFYNLR